MIDHSRAAEEVRAAAARLVTAFAEGRVDDYFACFAPDATFLFHTMPHRLESRDAYRAAWERWEREDGFQVLRCASTRQKVQVHGDVAIFSHSVETVVRTRAGEETLHERETIVFHREGLSTWRVVHEHLSPDPAF